MSSRQYQVIILTLDDGTRHPFLGRLLPESITVERIDRLRVDCETGGKHASGLLDALDSALASHEEARNV